MNDETEKEMQKMLERGKQAVNDGYAPRIDLNVKQKVLASERADKALNGALAPAKAFHSATAVMFEQFADIYRVLNNLVQTLMELQMQNVKDLGQLGESIEEIRNTLGMDVSKVKADIEGIRATVNLKEIAVVAKFAEDFNKQVEETKKKLEEYKKKMKENDLAS
jgi:DNA-directed RNA polymerase alpha subunit